MASSVVVISLTHSESQRDGRQVAHQRSGSVPPLSNETDKDMVAVAFINLLVAIALVWEAKPHLYEAGFVCTSHGHRVAAITDRIIVADLAWCTLAQALRCVFTTSPRLTSLLRLSSKIALAFGFLVASIKAVVLITIYGGCGLFQMYWCCSFVFVAILSCRPPPPVPAHTNEVSKEDAEAAVDKVMNGMSQLKWSEECLEDGMRNDDDAQCCVCLDGWGHHDAVMVTRCGHSFHEGCLREWLVQQMCTSGRQLCAMCRRDVQIAEEERWATQRQ